MYSLRSDLYVLSGWAKLFTHSSACVALVKHGFQACMMSNLFCTRTYGDYAYQTKSFVSPTLAAKLRKAQKNDLIIATTSENIEDVCKPLVWLGEEEVCVSGETYIFKHNQNPKYLAYYLKGSIIVSGRCKTINR